MRLLLAVALLGSMACGAIPARSADDIPASGSPITVVPLGHSTVGLIHGDTVVLIDPARFVPTQPEVPMADLHEMGQDYLARFGAPPPPAPGRAPLPELLVSALPIRPEQMARFSEVPRPTLILVTHDDTDHLDPRAIAALRTPTTRIIVPTAAADRMLDVAGAEAMANGDRKVVGDVEIEAVPMYNLQPEAQTGAILHLQGRGNGYVISLGGRRIYVAGDTDCVPEIRSLRNIDVAFVPMNPPYTMPPAEAAACVLAMRTGVVYPYHSFESDPAIFEGALRDSGIDVRLREWYGSSETTDN